MADINFEAMTKESLYSEGIICQIMDEPDPLIREQLKFELLDRAEDFGKTTVKRVESMLKIAEKDMKAKAKSEQQSKGSRLYDNYTEFGDDYPSMKCGSWIADEKGIKNPYALPDNQLACSHPILPIETITNVEEGTQKVRLAFKRGGQWFERIVPKTVIANRSKISDLAGIGIAVTSETAKSLVKYLADIEQYNFEEIPEIRATARMGWCNDTEFMPYYSDLDFDRDGRFDTMYDTISISGDRQKWMDFVLDIRATKRIEPRIALAASLASVLIKPCGLLPFWVDFWGRSGGGKSVCGMLAASVWADAEIGKYISKFDATVNAFEAKAGFLNNLPFIIDDTAELRRKLKDDFSQLIYQLASGEGRGRSNTKLGLAYKATWRNVIICSGESPLITDRLQGGAVNRVLEYEVDEGDIFPDGQAVAALLRSNYGFIGKEFVKLVSDIGFEKISELQREYFTAIKNDNYEDKQLRSLSALLLADGLAAEYIFKDNITLSFEEVEKLLADKVAFSENERCYEYLISEIAVNEKKFVPNECGEYVGECWGRYFLEDKGKTECVAVLSTVFQRLCESGGYSQRAFSAWALKKGLLYPDANGKASKPVRLKEFDKQKRCYVLKMPDDTE